ncbi:MAG: molybdate ABC transporter substrate-binding protein [Beijerinckiaceae bacterium]|nr:molybdate ABC transporter substrate-binding protein [Beijerinckiaceae bacterium]
MKPYALQNLLAACFLTLLASSNLLANDESLTVVAPVSLKQVIEEVGKTFNAHGGPLVKFSFTSSVMAAKQIEAGMPADVYISTDVKWMDYMAEKKLIQPETKAGLFGNSLVLIVPGTSNLREITLTSEAITNAIGEGKFTISHLENTTSGEYGKSALKKLGLWDVIEPHIQIVKHDMAGTAFVSKGEVNLGLVFYTEAKSETNVRIVATLPEDSHLPIIYSFAATSSSKGDNAKLFIEYLKTPSAISIFEKAGFTILSK